VLQQFKIANGEKLGHHRGPDPTRARHRVPDQRRGTPDAASCLPPARSPSYENAQRARRPAGLRCRRAGSVIGGQFRLDAVQAHRVRRQPARRPWPGPAGRWTSSTSKGWPPSSPFHRAVVSDPAFIGDDNGFAVHTRWIETEWKQHRRNRSPAASPSMRREGPAPAEGRGGGRRPTARGVAAG